MDSPVMKHALVASLLLLGLLSVLPTVSATPGADALPLDHCEDIPPTTYECIIAYYEWALTLRGNGALNYLCRYYLTGNDCVN